MSFLRPYSRLLTTGARTFATESSIPATSKLIQRSYASSSAERKSDEKIGSKDDLNPRRREGTKSGYDDEIASDNAAYDPNVTNPEKEKKMVGNEEGKPQNGAGNPLDASGATPERGSGKEDTRPTKGKKREPSGGKQR